MKKAIILLMVTCYSVIVYSQDSITPIAPSDNTLDEAMVYPARNATDAYAKLEPNIIADIEWLNTTHVSEQKSMRDDKMRFILMWMTGSSAASVQIDDRVVTFTDADTRLLFTYLTGWTKYSITHNYTDDPIQCSVAAIKDVVAFYKKNREDIKKSKQVEAYSKLIDEGLLEEHITNVLSNP